MVNLYIITYEFLAITHPLGREEWRAEETPVLRTLDEVEERYRYMDDNQRYRNLKVNEYVLKEQ